MATPDYKKPAAREQFSAMKPLAIYERFNLNKKAFDDLPQTVRDVMKFYDHQIANPDVSDSLLAGMRANIYQVLGKVRRGQEKKTPNHRREIADAIADYEPTEELDWTQSMKILGVSNVEEQATIDVASDNRFGKHLAEILEGSKLKALFTVRGAYKVDDALEAYKAACIGDMRVYGATDMMRTFNLVPPSESKEATLTDALAEMQAADTKRIIDIGRDWEGNFFVQHADGRKPLVKGLSSAYGSRHAIEDLQDIAVETPGVEEQLALEDRLAEIQTFKRF